MRVFKLPNHHQGQDAGFAMAGVIMLGLVVAVIMALITTRTTSLYTSSGRDRGWEEAVFVAESALDGALSAIASNPNYSTVSAGTDLSTRAKVVAAAAQLAATPSNLILTPDGQFVIVRAAGSNVVYGVGATPSWTDSRRQVRVVEATVAITTVSGCRPEAALLGRGYVEVGSSSTISTSPATRHVASAYSNGDFKGASGTYIDGDIRVGGTISGIPAGNVYGTMQSGATPLWVFPTNGELTSWENQLAAQATAGATRGGIDLSTTMTLTAPVYINGDVFLRSGGRLTINGSGPVYVTGRFEMGGDSVLSNGALIAVHGQFKQGGGTQYLLTGPPASAGLVTFLVDKDAIIFEGAATGTQGVIYAARGGVKLSGSAALQGAAIAGGEGTYGQIKAGRRHHHDLPGRPPAQRRLAARHHRRPSRRLLRPRVGLVRRRRHPVQRRREAQRRRLYLLQPGGQPQLPTSCSTGTTPTPLRRWTATSGRAARSA